MTAIVGLVDPVDGTVYMGGDSAGTNSTGDQSTLLNQKVFFPEKGQWFIFGCCGEFRPAQILQYAFEPPQPPGPNVNIDAFMTVQFIDAVRKCFRKAKLTKLDQEGVEVGYSFLVGYQGRVFRIDENFQVIADRKNYTALGAGESVALGAMFATEGLTASEERVRLALQASAHYHATVREPFTIKSMPFSKDWHKDVRAKKRNGKKRQ